MTACYLTETEIVKVLRLPSKPGRTIMSTWKMHPSFPKPDSITKRWWFPEVIQWLNQLHNVDVKRRDNLPEAAWASSSAAETEAAEGCGPNIGQRPTTPPRRERQAE